MNLKIDNILIVVPYLHPALAYGGPAKVVFDLAEELAAKNSVTVYTTDAWDARRRILEKEKIPNRKNFKVKYFHNLINSIAYRYRIFTSFGMVFSYLKERDKFDIVHINDVFVLPNLLIGYLALLFKKPYVYSPHGVLDPLRTKKKYFFKKLVYELLAKRILQGANTVVATSNAEKAKLQALGYKNVITIFNGVPIQKFQPTHKFQKYRDERKVTLLYIGKIHPLKGLKELSNALRGATFSFQLLIAGPDDGDMENIKLLISKSKLRNIYFLGFVNDNEKAELFNLSDLFVYPSLSEGFSISILEAMTYGLPVLITEACNFPDVKKYKAGIVLGREGKLEFSLQRELAFLSQNRALLKLMGENAKELVTNKYSIISMANKIQKIYDA
jgi:glycosyltransferase involved in cell wall biosynthesis